MASALDIYSLGNDREELSHNKAEFAVEEEMVTSLHSQLIVVEDSLVSKKASLDALKQKVDTKAESLQLALAPFGGIEGLYVKLNFFE